MPNNRKEHLMDFSIDPAMAITSAQNDAADAILEALRKSAELVPDTCEGSAGHLRDEAVNEARADLDYIRTDPTSSILALEDGGFLTIEVWLADNTQLLAEWHKA